MTAPATPEALATRGVADAVFDVLRGWGVEHVFICPGSTEAAFLDASLRHPDVRMVLTTHESVATSMADGYARATGKPAVVYVHTNVGLTNTLSHLSCAWLDHSPLVLLNGLKPTSIQAAGGFTTVPSVRDLVRQYVKSDWQSLRADAVADDVNRALRVATTGPSGPAYVAISQDLFESPWAPPAPEAAGYRVQGAARPDPRLVSEAAALLCRARRPLIVAGEEVARTGGVDDLVDLAERACAPVVTEERRTLTRLAFPVAHPHFCGFLASSLDVVRDADAIFLLGARSPLIFDPAQPSPLPTSAALVHLSCDPGEPGKLGPVAVPLVANARYALRDLLAAIEPLDPGVAAERGLRVRRARDAFRHEADQPPASVREDGRPLTVAAVMGRLAELLGPEPVVVEDATTSANAVRRQLVGRGGVQRFFSSSGGSLGWGVGAALGMQLADPDREVVAVVGDGGVQFGLPGLATAVAEELPVTILVVNNGSYAAVKAALIRHAGDATRAETYPGSDISGPDYAAIAAGFGARGARVADLDALDQAIAATRARRAPTLIEVMTDPDDPGPI